MTRNYLAMTAEEIGSLEKDKTVFFMTLSPVEVHGYHLPLGTDVYVGEAVKELTVKSFVQSHQDYTAIEFPPLFLGSDPVPYPGSISISPKSLSDILLAFGRDLAQQGFKYMVLTDNHGGPRHQLAVYKAARRLYIRHGFYLIDPFLTIYSKMVRHDAELLNFTGLSPGTCGDDRDNHAGTNETSLALAIGVKPTKEVAPSVPPVDKGLLKFLKSLVKRFSQKGKSDLGEDLIHLVNTLSWVGEKPLVPYMGDPNKAQEEKGRVMLLYHAKVSLELLEKALEGKDISIDQKPLLSFLSFLA